MRSIELKTAGRPLSPGISQLRHTPKDRRRSSLARLQAETWVMKAYPRAGQLQVRDRRSPCIDFWPDTGVWAIQGTGRHQRGLRKLLDFLRHNH
ncbi:hypothetical protein BN873_950042 [Candidatus Competibacter denitrificans Run_A_D11]|jgi:hypothetical protein|uniref:Uncharacterized protein n=1 Tax=Candidatus Competibacter denitrificans Run_A_D11 TaxID=1400863 RepID=W6MBK6_9GAMM|nr:hypothetical protein [Candidatus Competibacter denitrificans]CDI04359.1 hypothetical protein BN873_950042 [Candidatus Competibacter denitrificans Run_A_D11]